MASQKEFRDNWAKKGVVFVDADTVYLQDDTEIGFGTSIEPFVVIGKSVKIGENCTIKAFSHIEAAVIENGCIIGPFARIRTNSVIKENGGIGNFVEVARSTVGKKTAAWHFNYIADAEIGDNVEIGGGMVTCNFDGFNKHKTIIEDDSFVGSNVTLVAPVRVGKEALVAAGSVVSGDIEKDALVIARALRVDKPNGASAYKRKKQKI